MTLEGLLLTKRIYLDLAKPYASENSTLTVHTHTHTPFYRPGHLAHWLAISLKAPPAFVNGGEDVWFQFRCLWNKSL